MPIHRSALLPLLLLLACRSGASQSANADLDAYLSNYGQEFQRLNHESVTTSSGRSCIRTRTTPITTATGTSATS